MTPGRRLRAALVSLAAVGLAVSAASPAFADGGTPETPTQLLNNNVACATDQSAAGYFNADDGMTIEGAPEDSVSTGVLTETYQLWPVGDPTQISSWSLSAVTGYDAPLQVPAAEFADGQTYAWQAETVDGAATSAWSAPCYVNVDDTHPAAAPTVTSTNYPEGVADQQGAPVHVTFGANGVSDVAGYVFTWVGSMPGAVFNGPLSDPYVGPAGSEPVGILGGSATLDLVPSSPSGYMQLTVASVDRAGNESPTTTYTIVTNAANPTIKMDASLPTFDEPTTFTLAPDAGIEAQSPVTSYNVMVAGDPSGQKNYTVPAKADGTAQTQITFDSTTGEYVYVTSVSADGWTSSQADYTFGTSPKINSKVYVENGTGGGVGVTGTFTFAPPVTGVASYSYSWDYGTTQTIVKAHDGKATISWTPTAGGSYDIEVYAILKDGTELYPYDYFFNVS